MNITLGSAITFLFRGVTRTGNVFGAEMVQDDRRRQSGVHLFIRTPDREVIDVHESAIGGLIEEAPE